MWSYLRYISRQPLNRRLSGSVISPSSIWATAQASDPLWFTPWPKGTRFYSQAAPGLQPGSGKNIKSRALPLHLSSWLVSQSPHLEWTAAWWGWDSPYGCPESVYWGEGKGGGRRKGGGEVKQTYLSWNLKTSTAVSSTLSLSRRHTPGHLLDALRSVVLVVDVAGHVFEVVHVWANQHVPQFHKVAVRLVLHWAKTSVEWMNTPTSRLSPIRGDGRPDITFNDPPGVQPASHSLPSSLHHCVAADHGERGALLHIRGMMMFFFFFFFNPDLSREADWACCLGPGTHSRSDSERRECYGWNTLYFFKIRFVIYLSYTHLSSWSVRGHVTNPQNVLLLHWRG